MQNLEPLLFAQNWTYGVFQVMTSHSAISPRLENASAHFWASHLSACAVAVTLSGCRAKRLNSPKKIDRDASLRWEDYPRDGVRAKLALIVEWLVYSFEGGDSRLPHCEDTAQRTIEEYSVSFMPLSRTVKNYCKSRHMKHVSIRLCETVTTLTIAVPVLLRRVFLSPSENIHSLDKPSL